MLRDFYYCCNSHVTGFLLLLKELGHVTESGCV